MKVVNPDAAKPAVDLEQPAVVTGLMGLLLGDQVSLFEAGIAEACAELSRANISTVTVYW